IRRVADRRIEEAMREGKFDNLQGSGQPLDLEPMPANEDARLAWWALRIFKQNDFTPEEVRWRKQIDTYRDEIAAATTDRRIKALVEAHNQLVLQLNTLGTNALRSTVAPLTLETELVKLKRRLEGPEESTPDKGRCANRSCQCGNPLGARFCRRCGIELAVE